MPSPHPTIPAIASPPVPSRLPSNPVPFLRHVPLLRSLDAECLLNVGASVGLRRVARGELVTLEGQPVDALYIVASGSFKRFRTSPAGREQILQILGCGDTFGEVPLLDDGPDFASTQALQDGVLYALPRSRFRTLLREPSALSAGLHRTMATRIRVIAHLVGDLSCRHVAERLARLILEQDADPTRPRLTQTDMAAAVGTTRVVVARTLRELKQSGAIDVSRRAITVRDRCLLRDLAGDDLDRPGGASERRSA